MARLDGKVAIITGAASGMGLAAATLFAAEGAKVVASDVTEQALSDAVEQIRADGGEILGLTLDVASEESWADAVDTTIAEFGQIDILINNAGIHIPNGVLEAQLDDWNKVLAVDITGVWLGIKAVIPHMQRAGGGSIVNVSSLAALLGGFGADGGGAAYSAAKGGVRSISKHVAQAFAKDGIRSNSIHPGAIFTGMARAAGLTKESMAERYGAEIPLPPHVGEPEDIAYGMLFLASNESKFITAQELVIDGGQITH